MSAETVSLYLLAIIIVTAIVLGNAHKARMEERKDKLRILEEAVRNNRLDPATRDDLFEVLTGRRPGQRRDPNEINLATKAVFVVGWLGIFLGIALFFAGIVGHGRQAEDMAFAGAIVGISSFGLLSVPLALRELSGRKRAT